MWNFSLSQQTYKLYAIANYKNGKGYWNEFFSDIKTLQNIPKILSNRVEKNQPCTHALNAIIKLGNVFKNESLSRLLFIVTPQEYISDLKTILLFISRLPKNIPELNINEISINESLYNELKKL